MGKRSLFRVRDNVAGGKRQNIFFITMIWDEVVRLSLGSGMNISQTVNQLCLLGRDAFEKKFIEGREPKAKAEIEEKKKEEPKQEKSDGEKLSDAYGREVLQSWKKVGVGDSDQGWTPV